jgi:hypothetical protein
VQGGGWGVVGVAAVRVMRGRRMSVVVSIFDVNLLDGVFDVMRLHDDVGLNRRDGLENLYLPWRLCCIPRVHRITESGAEARDSMTEGCGAPHRRCNVMLWCCLAFQGW